MKEIPYDFVARFTLSGKRGARQFDVFNVSTDGAFVAVSIAHSFEFGETSLEEFCRNPFVCQFQGNLLQIPRILVTAPVCERQPRCLHQNPPGEDCCSPTAVALRFKPLLDAALDVLDIRRLLLRIFDLRFKYSVIDSGTGRELQNLPIPSLSGLGNANGDRPFRTFPKPMFFMPRSTIRIEVEEVSRGLLYAGGELTLVLHGYKILGYER